MTEIFVPINGYEELYEIGNLGTIRSLPKYRGTNYTCPIPAQNMKWKDNGRGYMQVSLCKASKKKQHYVHILVATHFVNNPDNLPEVNHADGNKMNNAFHNLEWATRKSNEEHAWRIGLKNMKGDKHHASKRVLQFDLNGNIIQEWTNGNEVMNTLGFANCHISKCCRGLAKTAYGFKWQYKSVA